MRGLFHIQGSPGDGLITQSARGERLLRQSHHQSPPIFHVEDKKMKLSVGDIKLSKFGCTSTNVGVEIGDPPFLICTMGISVPLVEGKALEQYKEELLAKARERIASMYKEIVCGGSQVLKPFKIEITSSPRDKLEERVANLELQLAEVKESTSCHMQLMQNNIQEIKSRTIQPHLSNRSC
ncbi:hypothetical protein DPS62_06670 [Salmonella enterica subsp. enterica]|nr:hypothetical protein [Salmonella enterica subsp. enterica serovar Newport]